MSAVKKKSIFPEADQEVDGVEEGQGGVEWAEDAVRAPMKVHEGCPRAHHEHAGVEEGEHDATGFTHCLFWLAL